MDNLYEIQEVADKYLTNNDIVPKDLISSIKQLITEKGFIGLAQINTAAGDIECNAKKIAKYIKYGTEIGLELVVFPELSLVGSPLGDTFQKFPIIVDENIKWLNGLAKITKETSAIVGFIDKEFDGMHKKYYDSVAILKNGHICKTIRKKQYSGTLLDYKHFSSVSTCTNQENQHDGYKIVIGNDFDNNEKNIDSYTIINPSISSNFEDISDSPLDISKKNHTSVLYVNRVGADDSTSFSGGSCAYSSNGELIALAKSFKEQLLIVNPNKNIGKVYPINSSSNDNNENFSLDYEQDLERVYKTIIQGIKDYFAKCGLQRAVLGLSGGLDSSVCAVLLADALGRENVFGISMPSKITSDTSKSDAEKLAHNLGINFSICPIKDVVDTTSKALSPLFKDAEKSWNNRYKESYTMDNIQARTRATYLWGLSNEFPACIPIATSDKSEAYMGYATINGDMSGGYAPIADITKTKLFALARWLNKNRTEKNVIPQSIIDKKPGAELAINPKTGKPLEAEEALMPYEFLDEIIWRIENKKESYDYMLHSEFVYEKTHNISKEQKEEWLNKFYKRMSSALYKWSIFPPSTSVEKHSINKTKYNQPIVSGNINYKGVSEEYISSKLSNF